MFLRESVFSVGRDPCVPPKNAYPAAGHTGPALQDGMLNRAKRDVVDAVPYRAGRRGRRPLQNNTKTGTAFSPSLTVCAFYTYRWVVTSNTPRVVMRRLGITGSAMKLSVMNGSMPVDTPSS